MLDMQPSITDKNTWMNPRVIIHLYRRPLANIICHMFYAWHDFSLPFSSSATVRIPHSATPVGRLTTPICRRMGRSIAGSTPRTTQSWRPSYSTPCLCSTQFFWPLLSLVLSLCACVIYISGIWFNIIPPFWNRHATMNQIVSLESNHIMHGTFMSNTKLYDFYNEKTVNPQTKGLPYVTKFCFLSWIRFSSSQKAP